MKRASKFTPAVSDDYVAQMLKRLGYTSPAQSMNVGTAAAIARHAAFDAARREREAVEKGCCGRCKSKFEMQRGGIF